MQQHGSFAILLFFLIDEVLKMFYKVEPWALKTVAAPMNLFLNQSPKVGALTCKKNINDCP
jgi:hypothetical protein